MKRKIIVRIAVLGVIAAIFGWTGTGVYSGSSAVWDLKIELEAIYGTEYKGKDVENGTEDMVFVVEPKTRLLTNWNIRNAFSMDYKYVCQVIFATYVDGNIKSIRTITYQAVDPMGAEKSEMRAYLELDTKTETTENK